jgi:hypothetical protein
LKYRRRVVHLLSTPSRDAIRLLKATFTAVEVTNECSERQRNQRDGTSLQNGLYAHRAQADRVSCAQPGVEAPATPTRSLGIRLEGAGYPAGARIGDIRPVEAKARTWNFHSRGGAATSSGHTLPNLTGAWFLVQDPWQAVSGLAGAARTIAALSALCYP